MTQKEEIKQLFDQVKSLVDDTRNYARVSGVNFFKKSFEQQGFLDTSLNTWKKRAFNEGGGAILVKSGALKRGIKGKEESKAKIRFFVDESIPYAAIHNDGGEIAVTMKMKKYFWYLYSKSSSKVTKTKSGKESNSKSSRAESGRAAFYKAMAMKKVGSRIRIPKRQFIGESATLMKQLDEWLIKEIDNRFK
jgi:phage gpG-like protein